MITNQVPIQIAKLIGNSNPASPNYWAFGSGTTAASQSDTALVTESGARKSATVTVGSNVVKSQVTISSTDSDLQYGIKEVGNFDASSTGTLYNRDIVTTITPTIEEDHILTKFFAINPSLNNNRTIITDDAISKISNWFAGTSFTEPTHIAFGTLKILDSCDSLGSGGNTWNNSTYATAASLNTSDFTEGTSSINLGKSTGGAVFTYSRTLASVVVATGMTQVNFRINFLDLADINKLKSTGCFIFSFGNDSSNYYSVTFDRADLSVGWSYFEVLISSMTETGTVDLANIDYINLTFETTNATDTIATGNILMDYFAFYRDISSNESALIGEITRSAQETGYPSISGNQVSFYSIVTKATGNTYSYNYVGLFNANSSGDLFLVNYFYDLIKDANTQITQQINISSTLRSL